MTETEQSRSAVRNFLRREIRRKLQEHREHELLSRVSQLFRVGVVYDEDGDVGFCVHLDFEVAENESSENILARIVATGLLPITTGSHFVVYEDAAVDLEAEDEPEAE